MPTEPEVTQFTMPNQFVAWSKLRDYDVFVHPDGRICTIVGKNYTGIEFIPGTIGNRPTEGQRFPEFLFKSQVQDLGDDEPHFLVLWRMVAD